MDNEKQYWCYKCGRRLPERALDNTPRGYLCSVQYQADCANHADARSQFCRAAAMHIAARHGGDMSAEGVWASARKLWDSKPEDL